MFLTSVNTMARTFSPVTQVNLKIPFKTSGAAEQASQLPAAYAMLGGVYVSGTQQVRSLIFYIFSILS